MFLYLSYVRINDYKSKYYIGTYLYICTLSAKILFHKVTSYSSKTFPVLESTKTKLESICVEPETMAEISLVSFGISSKMTTVLEGSAPSTRMVLLLWLPLRRSTLRQWASGQSQTCKHFT